MFGTARLRLTLWYLAVLAAIVLLLSLALYDVLLRLQQAEAQALGRVVRHGVAQLFARDAQALAWQIGAIDLGMLILASLGAYVLAGRTLRPIQAAMDRQLRFAVAASHELRTPLTVLQGTMEVALEGGRPAKGDRLKLRQALTNLLDNAVTYTPEGGTIRLTARQDHGRAVIAVRDTGPGIAAQHLPHLFEPFYRVDAARGGGSGHSGLGLALAAWIIRAHGGHLSVESRVGVGTVFTLSLPLASRAHAPRSRDRGPVQSPAPQ